MQACTTMNFAPDIVNVMEATAELSDFAVMTITLIMRVMIGKWPLPEMANEGAVSKADD